MGLGSDKTIPLTAVVGVQGAGGGCPKETQNPSSPKASDSVRFAWLPASVTSKHHRVGLCSSKGMESPCCFKLPFYAWICKTLGHFPDISLF